MKEQVDAEGVQVRKESNKVLKAIALDQRRLAQVHAADLQQIEGIERET